MNSGNSENSKSMKANIKHYSIVIFCSLAVTVAKAQTYSLDSVLRRIDREHRMLQEYDHKAQALNAYAQGANSWMPPMVGVGTFMTPYPGQNVMEGRDKGSLMISIEQAVPNPARLNAAKRYLESRAAVETQGRAIQYNALRAEARELYYNTLVLEEKRRILRENEQIVYLMIKLARIRYPYNQGSLASIYKAEGRLGEVQNEIEMTEAEAEENQYRLKALMNLPTAAPFYIDTATKVTFNAQRLAADTAALTQQRSDVKQIEASINTMRLNQQLQRYQAKPDFKLRFDHMQPLGNMMPAQFTAMAMVSIPIAPWSSRMYRAEVKGMQYDIAAMQKGREAILLETRGMLAGLTARIDRMQQQMDNYTRRIIPALRRNYETLMLGYEENREQLPAVIDAWEAFNMATMEYLEKRNEYYTLIVQYEKETEQ